MSEGVTIPLAKAEATAAWLIDQLAIPDARIVGSIRRRRPYVHDIDLICPMPRGSNDLLHQRVLERFSTGEPDGLFGLKEEGVGDGLGALLKGRKRMTRIMCMSLISQIDPTRSIPVQIHRHAPGPAGNRGWIELIRTGPLEFGRRALARWKVVSDGGWSKDGYPHASNGARVSVPDERAAFGLLHWRYIEPERRR